jgi:hypothetical protein
MMQMRIEISEVLRAINEDSLKDSIRIGEDELAQLQTIVNKHPEVWPMGLINTFKLLQRKLRWESIDRQMIPAALLDFFDDKFRRDLDPMALARSIGQDLCTSCADCECRC